MRKIIVAPDSFKGSLRSIEAAKAIASGIHAVLPDVEIIQLPMADGGEGTVDALIHARGGKLHTIKVHDPLDNLTSAAYGILPDGVAVMEMAAASGIELVPSEKLNPMAASSFGTGEMLADAITHGAKRIIIGIGGSATVDGGTGMLQALGFILRDRDGNVIHRPCTGGTLSRIASIEAGKAASLLDGVQIDIACDVNNPLTGPRGAARVYGPQKGATPQMVESLESGLAALFQAARPSGFTQNGEMPGDGAAGGLGFALRVFCKAASNSGAKLVIAASGIEQHLADADLLITGEGCTDSQTTSGKICAELALTAEKYSVPTVVLAGGVKGRISEMQEIFASATGICKEPCSLSEAIAATVENLHDAARNLAGIIKAVSKGNH